jgi:RHS repeat-associated protein
LDELAAVISYEEYYPYGSTSYQAGRTVAEVSLKRYRYTGKERDEETGLYYHGARYCAAWIGRWISCDPIGTGDGVNLYAYVKDKPTSLVDPTGTDGRDDHPAPANTQGSPPPGQTTVTVTDEHGNVVGTSITPDPSQPPGAGTTEDTGPDPGLPSLTTTQGALGLPAPDAEHPARYRGVESFGTLGGITGPGFAGPVVSLGTAVRYGLLRPGGLLGGDVLLYGVVGGQSSTGGFGGGAALGVTPHFWLGRSTSLVRGLLYGTAAATLGQSPNGAFPVSPLLQILPGLEIGGRSTDYLQFDLNVWAYWNLFAQDATGAALSNQGGEGASIQLGIKTDPDSSVQFGPEFFVGRYSADIPGATGTDPRSATGFTVGAGFFVQRTVSGNSARERSAWGIEPFFSFSRDNRGTSQTDTFQFGLKWDLGGNQVVGRRRPADQ